MVHGPGDASNGLAAEDWVHSEGTGTGLTIGLYSDSAVAHNTGVSDDWSIDPQFYLNGTDEGNGDHTIGLAFDIGDLLANEVITFTYSYVMGDSLENVDIPVDVPEPSTLALLGLGLASLGLSRRRKA
ncbi:PEP-CTERM sorting domain-containing protein [Teredinibacter haidensis]|uniref:PEP-CTERM sorting domain-containing protein n=1 Tax=Teredinibacter haidensis TaxID=2731755 RepID=UPI000948D51A|nr:PEP-CTERM sorting domain-containing protein [Teredinibacter haidensis]